MNKSGKDLELNMKDNRERSEMVQMSGLTSAQVAERRAEGLGNDVELTTSRSSKDIIKENILNPVSLLLAGVGVSMVFVGDFRNAIGQLFLVVFNTTIGIIQEVRAKTQLDQIALLAQAKVNVMRDGSKQKVDPSGLVQGDLLVIQAGDQVPVDGIIVGEGRIEVDESTLTGESDSIAKATGDTILSGSYCVSGETLVEATGVGDKSFANELTKNAREFTVELTPLQKSVNRILRFLLLIVIFYTFLAVLSFLIQSLPVESFLEVLVVIMSALSAGLLSMITLNYTYGAVKIGQKGAVVQQVNAIESLSNVTVLCSDKTGTLTTNKITYHDAFAVGIDERELESALGDFTASATTTNKTTEAILDGLAGTRRVISDEVAFSSERKWSALAFDDHARQGVYVLGAFEMLEEHLAVGANEDAKLQAAVAKLRAWSEAGLRVLVFARNMEVITLHTGEEEPLLPHLDLIGVISFSDELRPHLMQTLDAFTDNDVQLKIMSGDNPQTVAALARQAGLPGDLQVVSGPELAKMGGGEFAHAAKTATIFGRISPDQKEALVKALRDQGEYVGMVGDGVNDVLSLKKANIGIAMERGSTAARSVSDMILMNDSFEAMPDALSEGQRIINSIQNLLKLYLVKVFALLLIIIAIEVPEIGFPFAPLQIALISVIATGLPAFILAITATSVGQNLTLERIMMHFTLPAAIGVFIFGLLIYTSVFLFMEGNLADRAITTEFLTALGKYTNADFETLNEAGVKSLAARLYAQTALTTFFVFTSIILMLFAQPPLRWFVGGSPYHGNKIPLISAIALLIAFFVLMAFSGVRTIFQMVPLPFWMSASITAVTVVWMVLQRAAWRANLFERFLGLELPENA